jgi:hypothetical protein
VGSQLHGEGQCPLAQPLDEGLAENDIQDVKTSQWQKDSFYRDY